MRKKVVLACQRWMLGNYLCEKQYLLADLNTHALNKTFLMGWTGLLAGLESAKFAGYQTNSRLLALSDSAIDSRRSLSNGSLGCPHLAVDSCTAGIAISYLMPKLNEQY